MNTKRSAAAPVREAARSLQSAQTTALRALQKQRAELAALKARRHELRTAPLSRADLEAVLIEDVTREQQRVLSGGELPAALWEIQRRPQATAAIVDGGPERANHWPLNTGRFDINTAGLLTLLLGEPSALVARLAPLFDQMDFSETGPSLADRRAELSGLEVSINALEVDMSEAEEELIRLGVAGADPRHRDQVGSERPDIIIAGPDARGMYRAARWGRAPGSEHFREAAPYTGWIWSTKPLDRAEVDALLANGGAVLEKDMKAKRS